MRMLFHYCSACTNTSCLNLLNKDIAASALWTNHFRFLPIMQASGQMILNACPSLIALYHILRYYSTSQSEINIMNAIDEEGGFSHAFARFARRS